MLCTSIAMMMIVFSFEAFAKKLLQNWIDLGFDGDNDGANSRVGFDAFYFFVSLLS